MIWSILVSLTAVGCLLFSIILDNRKIYKPIIMSALIIMIVSFTSIAINKANIDAIDVYRNKTALKIIEKSVNGVVVERDSIVILKQ